MTPATASDDDLDSDLMPAEGAGLSVAMAARLLAANEVSRAAFISPEGDEGVAASVMVAREASDAGLRVVFLDLTRSGVATFAMLEDASLPGVTNLLCSEAQFSEVIHADRYSECHIIPTGTADVAKAMRAIDRLPIILSSLETAYDLVVVECGQANASGIKRVAGPGTVVMLGATEPEDEHVQAATRDLEAGGFDDILVVTPAEALPVAPRGRRAA